MYSIGFANCHTNKGIFFIPMPITISNFHNNQQARKEIFTKDKRGPKKKKKAIPNERIYRKLQQFVMSFCIRDYQMSNS